MNRNKLTFTIILVLLGVFFIVTIFYKGGEKNKVNLPPGTHGVIVTEVIQTTNYTYLHGEENGTKLWIAVERGEYKTGDSVYYSQASEMKDFVSKELNRTFPSIFFVQNPHNSLVSAENLMQQPLTPQKVAIKRWTEIDVTPPAGGITIADLYKNPGNYAGKTVIIRGVVVRFNDQIMNKNWVHIQDGTDYSDKFDLTITTLDSLIVGSTATFKGIIALDKDFGSGYKYDVIMEEARISDIK
ncbi:MAG: hypothetical protein Q8M08_06705 [Bacteroidales bacterium]|nr:hypothetical protein [Bacteroidales bacterium]